MSVFRSGLREGGGRPRASAVAAALRMSSFGAAPPGARLAPALLVFAALFSAPTPAEAQMEITLIDNLNKPRQSGPFVGPGSSNRERLRAQRFTTGSNKHGYTVLSVELKLESVRTESVPSVSIHTESEQNPAASALYVLINPRRIANGTIKFNAPENATLEEDTDYFVVIGGSGESYGIEITTESSESGADGWSIQDSHLTQV